MQSSNFVLTGPLTSRKMGIKIHDTQNTFQSDFSMMHGWERYKAHY